MSPPGVRLSLVFKLDAFLLRDDCRDAVGVLLCEVEVNVV
jgi:hypothetical protein